MDTSAACITMTSKDMPTRDEDPLKLKKAVATCWTKVNAKRIRGDRFPTAWPAPDYEITALPSEMILAIIDKLSCLADVLNLVYTCKRFYNLYNKYGEQIRDVQRSRILDAFDDYTRYLGCFCFNERDVLYPTETCRAGEDKATFTQSIIRRLPIVLRVNGDDERIKRVGVSSEQLWRYKPNWFPHLEGNPGGRGEDVVDVSYTNDRGELVDLWDYPSIWSFWERTQYPDFLPGRYSFEICEGWVLHTMRARVLRRIRYPFGRPFATASSFDIRGFFNQQIWHFQGELKLRPKLALKPSFAHEASATRGFFDMTNAVLCDIEKDVASLPPRKDRPVLSGRDLCRKMPLRYCACSEGERYRKQLKKNHLLCRSLC